MSMPHSLDAYFNLYACPEVTGSVKGNVKNLTRPDDPEPFYIVFFSTTGDTISSSHAQNGKLLTESTSQESISRLYGGR